MPAFFRFKKGLAQRKGTAELSQEGNRSRFSVPTFSAADGPKPIPIGISIAIPTSFRCRYTDSRKSVKLRRRIFPVMADQAPICLRGSVAVMIAFTPS